MAARVLIIERNEKIGGLISSQLQQKGFEAVDVRHGPGAVMELRQQLADVIVLDNQVAMGGIRTARILRLHDKYNAIPIVVGLPPDRDDARGVIEQGQKVGLRHYLLKPFTLNALDRKLQEVLTNARVAEKPSNQEVRDEIRSLTALPAMPAAHSKLLMLLSKADEEVDMRQVSATLELDPALSMKVMRTCRSAYFGFQGSMMSQAVAFLGVAVVRKIVQTAVIYSVFGDQKEADVTADLPMMDLWRHSLAVGMAMEVIGKADKKKTHFLLGVLHDIGKAVFKFKFAEHFGKALELVKTEQISIMAAEYEIMGITHAECGGELAVHWELPAEVRTAIASHHTPGSAAQHKRLAAMVHIADIAVREMEIGYAGDPLIPPMDQYATRLQKSVEEIAEHKSDFLSQCDSILGGGDGE